MNDNHSKTAGENLHANHRKRMIRKFRSAPHGTMPEHELLELLLFFSKLRVNTNNEAHELLNYFGSFHDVFEADFEDLQKVCGIGEKSADLIKIVYECIRCYEASRAKPTKKIRSTEEAGAYFVNRLRLETREQPMVLILDNRDGIITCKPFGSGGVNYSSDGLQALFRAILTSNSAGVYIAHNHPRGIAVPSNDDLNLTERIRDICNDMRLNFKDHIIVADDRFCSVMEYLEKRK